MDPLKEHAMAEDAKDQPKHIKIPLPSWNKLKKTWWFWGGIIFFVLAFGVTRLNAVLKKTRLEKSTKLYAQVGEDRRELFKEKDLKSFSQGKTAEGKQQPVERTKPVKRNYATDIAAFIYQEKEKRNVERSTFKQESKKLGLPAGTKIPVLTTGTIFSFNVAAPVTVTVTEDIKKGGDLLIPKDSQFLGEAGILKSLNRINCNFHLLIFPNGRQMRVRAMALSEDGSAGIKGRVNKHRDTQLLKALGETVLGGAALFGRGTVSNDPYSLQDRLRENAFENLTGMARQDIRNVKTDVSITVDSFTPVQVILLEAV